MKSELCLCISVLLGVGGCGADSDPGTTSSLTTSNGAPNLSGVGGGSASAGGTTPTGGQTFSSGGQSVGGGVAGDSGASTGGAAGGAVDCTTIDQALTEFAAANRSCNVEFNCVVTYVDCAPIRSFCDGSVYLNAGYDAIEFMHLLDVWRGCNGEIDCAICDALTPPPACVDGVCVPQMF